MDAVHTEAALGKGTDNGSLLSHHGTSQYQTATATQPALGTRPSECPSPHTSPFPPLFPRAHDPGQAHPAQTGSRRPSDASIIVDDTNARLSPFAHGHPQEHRPAHPALSSPPANHPRPYFVDEQRGADDTTNPLAATIARGYGPAGRLLLGSGTGAEGWATYQGDGGDRGEGDGDGAGMIRDGIGCSSAQGRLSRTEPPLLLRPASASASAPVPVSSATR
jgi:hypothetical protein